jgi:hypothetical protein
MIGFQKFLMQRASKGQPEKVAQGHVRRHGS